MVIDECKVILAVVEEGSSLKAGDKIGLTQPAVSRIVSRVESKVGTPLFNKNKTPWILTKVGKIYVEKAREFIAVNYDFHCEIAALKQTKIGCLKLGVMDFEERNILPEILPKFYETYPEYLVKTKNLLPKKIEYAILAGEVDIGLIISPSASDGLEYIDLKNYEILVVLPLKHELAKDYKHPADTRSFPTISLKLLADTPFAIFPLKDHALGHVSFKLCKKHGFIPKIIMETERIHSIYSIVIAGYGAAFTLQGDECFSKDMAYFKIDDDETMQTIAFAFKKGRKLRKVEMDFLNIVQETFAKMAKL